MGLPPKREARKRRRKASLAPIYVVSYKSQTVICKFSAQTPVPLLPSSDRRERVPVTLSHEGNVHKPYNFGVAFITLLVNHLGTGGQVQHLPSRQYSLLKRRGGRRKKYRKHNNLRDFFLYFLERSACMLQLAEERKTRQTGQKTTTRMAARRRVLESCTAFFRMQDVTNLSQSMPDPSVQVPFST